MQVELEVMFSLKRITQKEPEHQVGCRLLSPHRQMLAATDHFFALASTIRASATDTSSGTGEARKFFSGI